MSRTVSDRVRTTQLSTVAVHRVLTMPEQLRLVDEVRKLLDDAYGPVLVGMLAGKSLRILSPATVDPDDLGMAVIAAGLLPVIAGPMSYLVRTQ